ncbi:hypothetical protein [Pseudooceanicola onchidii]|uniref:hypothetical protein n=1 Tax=Pseudooceanicola onchidii TaxID=2562279 RepID=UPI0010AAC186|nr:hypothetical protein [Pseudooceanicola onchidii]
MFFLQTNYFFIVTILSFLTGLSVCYALTSTRIWPKGLILPVMGVLILLQTVYVPIPGSDLLLIGGIGVMLVAGSLLGLGARVIVRAIQARRARFA